MRHPVHIPEVDQQTDTRRMKAFWIANTTLGIEIHSLPESPLRAHDDRSPLAVWLVRSLVNPHWHGLEADVPTGRDAMQLTIAKAQSIANISPMIMDLIGVVQPGEQPGIRHTTFMTTFMAEGLPKPDLPGIQMGLFPIDDLPTDSMGNDGSWVPELLAAAIKEGMGPDCAMTAEYAHLLALHDIRSGQTEQPHALQIF